MVQSYTGSYDSSETTNEIPLPQYMLFNSATRNTMPKLGQSGYAFYLWYSGCRLAFVLNPECTNQKKKGPKKHQNNKKF